ncbi:patatin-like phospholipase family protein [Nodosilinea sp. AN01ver1]|uniref:patatin-like phospholipase family protein n=1 Tax=Nodosilinea sp. AN01ver1 TaxID=3423362 RepID=UPI003D3190FB
MTIWEPSAVFKQDPDLRLDPQQMASIQRNLPMASDRGYYVDAVFEGGGVKGTAFLGALRCFADAGINFRKVAGTSAGAITAAMVAAGFTVDQLEQDVLGPLDYQGQILSQKTSPLIWNGSPSDDMKQFHWMLLRLLIARRSGQYSAEPFKAWLSGHLDQKLPTFAPFLQKQPADLAWHQKRDLKVVVSDISCQEMRVLPDDLRFYGQEATQFSVAEAVRLSMSIPLFFEPGQLQKSTIVDGGLLSNFPLWIYDAEPGQRPCCPTFGFRLMETVEECKPSNPKSAKPVKGALGILRAMVETMQVARDNHHIRKNEMGRIINIATGKISATQFDLTNADKDSLYRSGYAAAKAFLLRWSWEAHLRDRGFEPVAAPAIVG